LQNKPALRALVRSFYDVQKLRIEAGNRIVANVRVRLGQAPGQPTEDISEEGKQLLKEMRDEYCLITDGLTTAKARKKAKELEAKPGIISDAFEFELVGYYDVMCSEEDSLAAGIKKLVEFFPIWDGFLLDVRGCGPAMAAVIISELDAAKARHVSSFWKYAGLDVAEDGLGRSRRAEHLIDVEYTNRKGEFATRKGITFNPFLKTKLIGVLGTSFLRLGGEYRLIYDGYKHRLETNPAYADLSKGHRHNMAIRYMIKIFLKDLWLAMRTLEGLPITQDYAEAKLGLKHGA